MHGRLPNHMPVSGYDPCGHVAQEMDTSPVASEFAMFANSGFVSIISVVVQLLRSVVSRAVARKSAREGEGASLVWLSFLHSPSHDQWHRDPLGGIAVVLVLPLAGIDKAIGIRCLLLQRPPACPWTCCC